MNLSPKLQRFGGQLLEGYAPELGLMIKMCVWVGRVVGAFCMRPPGCGHLGVSVFYRFPSLRGVNSRVFALFVPAFYGQR